VDEFASIGGSGAPRRDLTGEVLAA